MKTKRFAWFPAAVLTAAAFAPPAFAQAQAQTEGKGEGISPVYTKADNLAINGYDAVAYFAESWPRLGKAEHTTRWNGAVWRFVSAENKALFDAAPESYAPQYGGYCAYAVSRGYTAPTDPTAWRIVDGKLYLNYNHAVLSRWLEDTPGNIAKGDANWPGVLR